MTAYCSFSQCSENERKRNTRVIWKIYIDVELIGCVKSMFWWDKSIYLSKSNFIQLKNKCVNFYFEFPKRVVMYNTFANRNIIFLRRGEVWNIALKLWTSVPWQHLILVAWVNTIFSIMKTMWLAQGKFIKCTNDQTRILRYIRNILKVLIPYTTYKVRDRNCYNHQIIWKKLYKTFALKLVPSLWYNQLLSADFRPEKNVCWYV